MLKKFVKFIVIIAIFATIAGISGYLTLTLIIKSEDTVIVPDLENKDVVYALELLTSLGLNTKVRGHEYSSDYPLNHVVYQDPEPGKEIKKGRDVNLIISKGIIDIYVPDIIGLTIAQAEILLEKNRLCLNASSFTYSNKFAKDSIIAQYPLAKAVVEEGQCIDCLISIGKMSKIYKMPDLKGVPIDEVVHFIKKHNLKVGQLEAEFYEDKPLNVIISQKPLPGSMIEENKDISFVVNKKPKHKSITLADLTRGAVLFRYKIQYGFFKKHIKAIIKCFGTSNDIFDNYVEAGETVWLLIPSNRNAKLELYEDDELIITKVFD